MIYWYVKIKKQLFKKEIVMKLKLELKILDQIPLHPETAAAILKQYLEEISADGYVFDELLSGKGLHLGVMYASGTTEIIHIKEISINEEKGYLFVDEGSEKRYFSLGSFTEIYWRSEK